MSRRKASKARSSGIKLKLRLNWPTFLELSLRLVSFLFFVVPVLIVLPLGLQIFEVSQSSQLLLSLLSLATLLITMLTLANSSLLEALKEEPNELKRFAISVSFIVISFVSFFWLGILLRSYLESRDLWSLLFTLLIASLLFMSYISATNHFVGILLDIAKKAGFIPYPEERKDKK